MLWRVGVIISLLLLVLGVKAQVIVQSLTDQWTGVHNLGGTGVLDDSYLSEFDLPFSHASAMQQMGQAPDINEIGAEDFYKKLESSSPTFSTQFNSEFEVLGAEHQELVLTGVDTYADVYLNDSLILRTKNAFRIWRVDVKGVLKEGENELRLDFISPLVKNKEKFDQAPFELPAGCEPDGSVNVSPYTRKAAYQFGWDWGPRLVTSALEDVKLEAWNGNRIDHIYAYTKKLENGTATQSISWELREKPEPGSWMEVIIGGKKKSIPATGKQGALEFTFENAPLWWPNGWGEQHLVDFTVRLNQPNGNIHDVQDSTAYRTIEHVNEKDKNGTSYYFVVNGEPIFCKGANYIPMSVLPNQVSDEDQRRLLTQAKDANMNMIRVWGGGIYERDSFYDLCDELGLMVWQDFMFAGSLYPPDDAFQVNVIFEVDDQIRRLRNHPCLVHFCGNNEVNVAFHNWGWQDKFGYSSEFNNQLKMSYDILFNGMIRFRVQELAPHVSYVHTSPLSNWGTPENFNHSSMHYWGVWHGKEAFSEFENNVGRFMVEYGFQSFPDLDLLSRWVPPAQQHLESDPMTARQKSYIGNGLIKTHSDELFGESKNFSAFVMNSQKTQAKAMEIAIKSHRKNTGHCMGTLFWQLNDCWIGPSWSVIDSEGNEKAAFDVVKELYAPTVAWLEPSKKGSDLVVVSDQRESNYHKVTVVLATRRGLREIWSEYLLLNPLEPQVFNIKKAKHADRLGVIVE